MTVVVGDIRNIAFCGHGTSGKTTLVDKLLVMAGAAKGNHSVDDGTSLCDFDEEEIHHKYSVDTSVTHLDHAGKYLNLLDTPGYPDFIGQAICGLHGADNANIVINAHNGIEVNTRRMFAEAGELGLGRILVVNRVDEENVDIPALVESIQELWGHACLPLNLPDGVGTRFTKVVNLLNPQAGAKAVMDVTQAATTLLEQIIEIDEGVTERYFEGIQPTDDEIARLTVDAIQAGELIPIVFTSAKTGVGLPELLDVLAQCALPPDRIAHHAKKDGTELDHEADPDGPLVAQVFKTRIDPFVQKLSFVRVYSGTLKKDDVVHASSARRGVKVGTIFTVQGHDTAPIDHVGPGEIAALAKLDDLHTGETLGDYELPPFRFPTPMVGLAVMPKTRGDETKLSGALHKIAEEDPTFHMDRDSQTKELLVTGMSELQLMIVQERLKRRDKVEVETHVPKIPYRETIQAEAQGSYRHKKQSGGRGQFGEVHIRMFPIPKDMRPEEFAIKERFHSMREFQYDPQYKFLWIDSIVGGTIPNNFMPAILKGFKERMERGVIAGCKVQNVAVEVHFGKHHPVDSSEAAFKIAGSMAFRNVFLEARPSLLEPIVRIHITVPAEKVGDVNSDLSGRRGHVIGMEAAGGGMQTVEAEVPLAEVSTYARTLSSMTGGQGSFAMEFSHYDVVPGGIQKEIIENAILHPEDEE